MRTGPGGGCLALGYLSGDGIHVELVLLCGGFADSNADVKPRLSSRCYNVRVNRTKYNGLPRAILGFIVASVGHLNDAKSLKLLLRYFTGALMTWLDFDLASLVPLNTPP